MWPFKSRRPKTPAPFFYHRFELQQSARPANIQTMTMRSTRLLTKDEIDAVAHEGTCSTWTFPPDALVDGRVVRYHNAQVLYASVNRLEP